MSAVQRRNAGNGGIDGSKRKNTMSGPGNESLNHLLNFSLPPRQTHQTAIPRRSRKTGNAQGVWNKEKFVNAQYRFIMNPTGDYTVHFADPDIYFQWQDILQVIVPRASALAVAGSSADAAIAAVAQTEGNTTCPICLAPPTAPRMTKCGHIFCFPCILHYLGTSETTKWARCPICFDSVAAHQLRSVHWHDAPVAEPGVLEMRLMARPQISTLALPRSATWPSDVLPPHQAPFYFMPDVFDFAKFMLATPDYLVAELTRELDELDTERRILEGLGDALGVTFVDAADEKVRRQIAKAQTLDTEPLRAAEARARREAAEVTLRVLRRAEYDAQRRDAAALENADVPPDPVIAAKAPKPRRNVNPPPPSTSTYYFYQAASGAPVFLHPLDIRALLARFGGYADFPDVLRVRVEAADEGAVDDALRRRCKYLAHVPEAAAVVFVDADLAAVVGSEALAPFEAALRTRRTKRKEKERKDDRARARAEERERERVLPPAPLAAAVPDVWEPIPPEALTVHEDGEEERPATIPTPVAGAWGSRSFAAATIRPSARQAPDSDHDHDDHDHYAHDEAWGDLDVAPAGRRGRKSRLVILGGSGGGGARRRR